MKLPKRPRKFGEYVYQYIEALSANEVCIGQALYRNDVCLAAEVFRSVVTEMVGGEESHWSTHDVVKRCADEQAAAEPSSAIETLGTDGELEQRVKQVAEVQLLWLLFVAAFIERNLAEE